MDACGGRDDDNGNYGYYTTVDFPYVLQCYRGELGNTSPSINDGICGLYGTNCESISPGLGPGSPFGGGRPGSRPGSGRPAGAPPSNGRPDDERPDSGPPDSGSPGDGPPKNRPPEARKKRSKTDPFANPTKAGFKSTHELMVLKDQALIQITMIDDLKFSSSSHLFENLSQHWLETNLDFHGGNGPYFQHKFLTDRNRRNQRSVSDLTQGQGVNSTFPT